VIAQLEKLSKSGVQVIWQTGKYYIDDARKAAEPFASPALLVTDFVSRMDLAYSIVDLVVSRAGASSISELCLLAKPAILVPSPNVAEDHQTQNALALVRKDAAVMIKDSEAKEKLIIKALELIKDDEALDTLSVNIQKLAEKDSADRIANEIMKLLIF
jgi:UDP-N-acetylglucosamine--N-acetylmuramyl-(pentapeptide) pyrophosphoryl-undecaprenol N-acetylglucosamine transferase